MFRRLASLNEGFDDAQNRAVYKGQEVFNTNVGKTIYTNSGNRPSDDLQDVVASLKPEKDPDMPKQFTSYYTADPKLFAANKPCKEAQKIDDIMNNSDATGCGWFYAPPQGVSWAPAFSQGWLSTPAGPVPVGGEGAPTADKYTYFYHDQNQDGQRLADGKQKILEDFCSTAKSCTDVQSSVYKGLCGWCPEGMSVPIKPDGSVMYPKKGIACAKVVISAEECPKPANNAVLDPNACVGPFSRGCIQTVLDGMNCNKGSLSLALTGSFIPSNTDINTNSIRTIPAMSLYNEKAETPFNISRFLGVSSGAEKQATIAEVMKIANAASSQPATSAIGAAARDLCLMPGSIDQYNFCDDLSTRPTGGWPTTCLQQAFRKAGGTFNGTEYPTQDRETGKQAINRYNTMRNWTDVKNDMARMYSLARGVITEGFAIALPYLKQGFDNYNQNIANTNAQASYVNKMMGIDAVKLGNRVPIVPGVEVFWMNGSSIVAYTVEPYMPSISGNTSRSAVVPGIICNNFIAFTDMRTTTVKDAVIQINTDIKGVGGGVALNKRLKMDVDRSEKNAISYTEINYTTGPNILTARWGGPPYLTNIPMSDTNTWSNWKIQQIFPDGKGSSIYAAIESMNQTIAASITREDAGPFLMFELVHYGGQYVFTDLRLPGQLPFFTPDPKSPKNKDYTFIPTASLFNEDNKPNNKPDQPGTRGYMTMNVERPMSITNVYINAIVQMTYVFRIKSISVGNYEFLNIFGTDDNNIQCGFDAIATRNGNDKANIQYYFYSNGANVKVGSPVTHALNTWYMGVFTNNITSWNLSVLDLNTAKTMSTDWTNQGSSITLSRSDMNIVSSRPNKSMEINFGRIQQNAGMVVDLAWAHMFNKRLSGPELQKDAKNSWMITTAQK